MKNKKEKESERELEKKQFVRSQAIAVCVS